jgi:hypothetical protein
MQTSRPAEQGITNKECIVSAIPMASVKYEIYGNYLMNFETNQEYGTLSSFVVKIPLPLHTFIKSKQTFRDQPSSRFFLFKSSSNWVSVSPEFLHLPQTSPLPH